MADRSPLSDEALEMLDRALAAADALDRMVLLEHAVRLNRAAIDAAKNPAGRAGQADWPGLAGGLSKPAER